MRRSINYCIYFLIKSGKVIYIGQTKDLKTRLRGHKDKNYDSVRFIKCSPEMLNHYETRWINKFMPIFNKDMNGHVCRVKEVEKHDNLISAQLVIRKDIFDMALKAMERKGFKSFNNYVEHLIVDDCLKIDARKMTIQEKISKGLI